MTGRNQGIRSGPVWDKAKLIWRNKISGQKMIGEFQQYVSQEALRKE